MALHDCENINEDFSVIINKLFSGLWVTFVPYRHTKKITSCIISTHMPNQWVFPFCSSIIKTNYVLFTWGKKSAQ